jgi:hypothetical protein
MTASPTDDLAPAERRIQELTKELSQARGELSQVRGELAEAHSQQDATAEILQVISSSPTDSQRVFGKIAASATRVCDAYDATVFQLDGDFLHPIAHYGPIPQGDALPLTRGFITVRVILDRQTIHITDMQAETDEFPESSEIARRLGHRTILVVPLIRAGEPIGVISIRRTEVPRSLIARSICSRFSPTKPSSPSRTRDFSALPGRRWLARPPLPTSSV